MRYVVVEKRNGGVRFRGTVEASYLLPAIHAAKREFGPECVAIPEKAARKLEPGAVMNEARNLCATASER